MSRKRPSRDESTIGDSDPVFQQDDNRKHARLMSLGNTMQDLPTEILLRILAKTVALEMKSSKVAKCAWKAKADVVITRLSAVCSQWRSILETSFFRTELHRTLDRTAQDRIRLEILHQFALPSMVSGMTRTKDEIFLFYKPYQQDPYIDVYDRDNMAVVKDVISLPRYRSLIMAGCSTSNCLYVLHKKLRYENFSVRRFKRDDQNQFAESLVIKLLYLRLAAFCVSANGSLIISRVQTKTIDAIRVFDANGSLLHKLRFPPDIPRVCKIIPKSNGNLVLASVHSTKPKLAEIDMNGAVVCQYQSSSVGKYSTYVSNADKDGCMLMVDLHANRVDLLDSEFNLLDFICPPLGGSRIFFPCDWHSSGERNEMVASVDDQNFTNRRFTIFHLTQI